MAPVFRAGLGINGLVGEAGSSPDSGTRDNMGKIEGTNIWMQDMDAYSILDEPNTISFCCDKITIDDSKLCLGFKTEILNLNKVETIIFEIGHKKYEFVKKKSKLDPNSVEWVNSKW